MIAVAFRMLAGDRGKFMSIVLGTAFSAFLTVYAACYFAGFMARSYALVAEHAPGVWVMDPRTASSDQFVNMASSAFDRVRSIAGVASAERLVVGAVDARLPDGRLQPFQIIGLDDASLAGLPRNPGGDGYALLRRPDAAIIDAGGSEGKLDFHDPAQGPRQLRPGDLLEANDRRIAVVAVSATLPRFPPRPLLYLSMANALRLLPSERRSLGFIIVHPVPGVDAAALAARIVTKTGLRALTAASFAAVTERWLFETSEDVGDITTMLAIATIIGFGFTAVMVYIFATAHLREFATLKALGTGDGTLRAMVLAQALICAVLGTALGAGGVSLLDLLSAIPEIPFRMAWYGPLCALGLNLLAAVAAALIGLRPIQRLAPAQVFAAA